MTVGEVNNHALVIPDHYNQHLSRSFLSVISKSFKILVA